MKYVSLDRFFENTVAELVALTEGESELKVRRALANSRMLSSDVSAAYDPMFAEAFEKRSPLSLQRDLHSTSLQEAAEERIQCANAEYHCKTAQGDGRCRCYLPVRRTW